jgi:hypothetical protein
MTPSELFDIWAPQSAVWSRWAKPVLFAELEPVPPVDIAASALPELRQLAGAGSAILIDLPSADAVTAGLALAQVGYRPVPLFNGARGPGLDGGTAGAVLDNSRILAWLVAGASVLTEADLPPDAPPAFMLDSRRRLAESRATPGQFDNRWVVFPQDFPSANFLRAHGFYQALLLQSDASAQPQEDLAHVLLRWQEAGLSLATLTPDPHSRPVPLHVRKPSRFRSLWYCALTIAGLRRNSAGGFGSIVPHPSSGTG